MFLDRYGSDKLLFGSDFPFGMPAGELRKVRELQLPAEDFAKVVCDNILKLVNPTGKES